MMLQLLLLKVYSQNLNIDVHIALLKFLYCEDVQLNYGLAIELLGLAEKYGVNHLKELCEGFLAETLTKENVSELSNVAECFEANNLKNYILKFNKKN